MSEDLEMQVQRDPYKVLGIPQGSPLAEVKKAYFSLIKEYTPEKSPEIFKRIRNAYEQLRSEKRKEETDFMLFEEGETSSDFEKPKEMFFNLKEDLFDIELWQILAQNQDRPA